MKPKLTAENCAYHGETPKGIRRILRIWTEGYSALQDGDFLALLTKSGADITATAASKTAGTLTAALTEVTYTAEGKDTMHAYVVTSSNIDTWQEEWITSRDPLTSDEAADLIYEGRRIARTAAAITWEQAQAAGMRLMG